ncbi:MAG: acylphosphatase [Candidatus Omnitrophota bacterium]|nr:acylphosphatase [Candidatus Omnitrophota bacterium]
MKRQARVFYSGRVQGVGFRFTARELAQRSGINGWVRNTSDGRVELLAAGKELALKDFLSELNKTFSSYISGTEIEWQLPQAEYQDFRVEF